MKRLRFIALFAVLAAVVAGCAGQAQSEPAPNTAAASVAPASPPRSVPEQLQFTAKTIDGTEFSGQSLLGKKAVLWFWAAWCPTCQHEAPMVGAVAQSHPDVTFVGVSGLDQVQAMQQFVDKYPVKGFTHLADTDGAVWSRFGVTEQPAFAFVHPDGGIDVVRGALEEPDLTKRIAAL